MPRYRSIIAASCCAVMIGSACGSPSSTEPDDTFQPWPEPEESFFTFSSEPGNWVGQGQSGTYGPGDGWVYAEFRNASTFPYLYVEVPDWVMLFRGPGSDHLELGRYEVPEGFAQADPGMNILGFHRGCNTEGGHFIIGYLAQDSAGNITRLRMTFEQTCDGTGDVLSGELAYVWDP